MSDGGRFARFAPGPACLFLNADADSSFTHTVRTPPRLARVAEALTTHALIGARPGDSVLLRATPEPRFLLELERMGVVPTLVTGEPSTLPAQLEPLAWNEEAARLAAGAPAGAQAEHPSVAVVRAANDRAFLAAIEARVDRDEGTGRESQLFSELEPLLLHLELLLTRHRRVVVKGAFGSASTGNMRLARHELDDPAGRVRLAQLLERHGSAVAEPWLERVLDLCATGEVARDGTVSPGRVDRTVHTDSGSPLGTLFSGSDAAIAPYRDAMLEALEVVGAELARSGYFGPFCLDGLVHRVADGRLRLRRFVDLNARQPVSWPVRRLLQQLDRPGVYYWRLFVPARLGGDGVARLRELLEATDAFDYHRVRGLLGLAPLSIERDGGWKTNPKLAVLIAVDTIAEAFEVEHQLRHQIDRRPPA